MKKIFLFLLVFTVTVSSFSQRKMIVNGHTHTAGGGPTILAAFRFGSGVTDLTATNGITYKACAGNPNGSVLTAVQNGITISTLGTAKWGAAFGTSVYNNNGIATGQTSTFFPTAIMDNFIINYSVSYSTAGYNFRASGFTPNTAYRVRVTFAMNTTDVSAAADGQLLDAQEVAFVINGTNYYVNAVNNLANGVDVNVTSDSNGWIQIFAGTDLGLRTQTSQCGGMSGIEFYTL